MYKIRRYFSTFVLTRGLLIALLSSAFIYLNYLGLSYPLLNTILGLTALYLLLQEGAKVWLVTGALIALFWFWWIALSLQHYGMIWAVPIEILIIMLSYGTLFWLIAYLAEKLSLNMEDYCRGRPMCLPKDRHIGLPLQLMLKAAGLLTLSYIHPFGFDWLKLELIFVESYIGIEKWQFLIVLSAISLSIWKKQFLYLLLIVFASNALVDVIDPTNAHSSTVGSITSSTNTPDKIQIVTTHTSVQDKWNETLHPQQFEEVFTHIDQAIDSGKKLVILPESVFPVFVNRSQELIDRLSEKAKKISIVTGGLYWDGETPRNSTYIFTDGKITVANKVVLVPFGESNPLPDFLSDWVNEVFYDGAVDYKASKDVIDYSINGITYRNAICFEATSEKLYETIPENMIVLSNNGWFTPSIEPTLQKLLLQYYSKKYGTTIYHSVNMSESYIIKEGKVYKQGTLY
ncbi:MAG: apolipoprotein N-acyltransferase [Sulfurovum sp.]|nr:MAG: apolipoprotein N-acyltransferase [Sulfurovum sp.]